MVEATPSTSPESQPRGRGRGRGKSRGGLGKYLRARGRGHTYGRPAEFTKRLVLEGEERQEIDPEEAEETHQRYSRRQLVSNADRYVEEKPELDSEGAWVFRFGGNHADGGRSDLGTRGFRRGDQGARSRSLDLFGKTATVRLGAVAFCKSTGGGRRRDRPYPGTYHLPATRFATKKGSCTDDRMGRRVRTDEPR